MVSSLTDSEFALKQLEQFKTKFDAVVHEIFNKEIKNATKINPELGKMLNVGFDFVINGGKRLRPAFVYFGYKAVRKKRDDEFILKSSVPIELVHASALIHDDIIDNSDTRRGKPTVHKVFSERFGNDKKGESLAIILGDMLFSLADEIFSVKTEIAKTTFNELRKEVNFGQHLDIVGDSLDTVNDKWITQVMRYKTAGYTVEKPLVIGAALGGASEKTIRALSKYGINLGLAFQIQDDILGMFGDEKKVGKPVNSDLKEGKKTLLVWQTLNVLSKKKRQTDILRFRSILGNKKLTKEDYLWCQKLMTEMGAVEYCDNKVKSLTKTAKKALQEIKIDPEAKRYLVGIADYLVNRNY